MLCRKVQGRRVLVVVDVQAVVVGSQVHYFGRITMGIRGTGGGTGSGWLGLGWFFARHAVFQLPVKAFGELLKKGVSPSGKNGEDPGRVDCRLGHDVIDGVGGCKDVPLDVELFRRNQAS